MESINVITNEKTERDIKNSIYNTLVNIGIRPSRRGLKELVNLIFFAYTNDYIDESLKYILEKYSKEKNVNFERMIDRIENALKDIDLIKCEKRFKEIFEVDFDDSYLTPKAFITLFLIKIDFLI